MTLGLRAHECVTPDARVNRAFFTHLESHSSQEACMVRTFSYLVVSERQGAGHAAGAAGIVHLLNRSDL